MDNRLLGVSGFDGAITARYGTADDNAGSGAAAFTALVAVTILEPIASGGAKPYVGNANDVSATTEGWCINRSSTVGGDTRFTFGVCFDGGNETLAWAVPTANVVGRTTILGIVVDGTDVSYFASGGLLATDTGTGAVVPGTLGFAIGSINNQGTVAGAPGDIIHGAAYFPAALSAAEMGVIFTRFVRTRSFSQAMLGLSPDLLYETNYLGQPPLLTPPPTWENLASPGTDDLVWGGANTAGILTFTVAQNPTFGSFHAPQAG